MEPGWKTTDIRIRQGSHGCHGT